MYIGKLLTVRYTCARVQAEGKFVFLRSGRNEFSTLIPKESLNLFPDVNSYTGKTLAVIGFLEEYKGNSQVVAFLPSQIIMSMQ